MGKKSLRALDTSPYADIIDGREPNALVDCLLGRATGTRIVGDVRGDLRGGASPGYIPLDPN